MQLLRSLLNRIFHSRPNNQQISSNSSGGSRASVLPLIPRYPRQFWLLFWGAFFTRISISMIWPFITVILRDRLAIPLTTAALLLTIQALFTLLSTVVISATMDNFGRKLPVLIGLVGAAATLFAMARANTLEQWIVLMALSGLFQPVFNIGVNTMIADIVSADQRSSAYALIRMIGNAGIAVGPVIGGTVVTLLSFAAVYYTIALTYALLALFVLLTIRETIPTFQHVPENQTGGYATIIRDGMFIGMFVMYMLVMFGNTQIFVLLPVYAKEVHGLVESEYSLLLSLNAIMVVVFQYAITRRTDRYRPLPVMAVAALFYTVGLGTVAMGSNLASFALSMIITTVGELLLMPTALTFTAAIAPTSMRARYMGILSLSWPLAAGVGPLIGGFLNDSFSPVAMWLGASSMALVGAIGFVVLAHFRRNQRV